jgi:hypothetical protein
MFMNKFLAITALTILSSSAFATTRPVFISGASASAVEQKVAATIAQIQAGGLPMQLAAFSDCVDSERNEFPKSVLNPIIRKVLSIQYNDNNYVLAADGTFRQSYSATLKVFCGKKLDL